MSQGWGIPAPSELEERGVDSDVVQSRRHKNFQFILERRRGRKFICAKHPQGGRMEDFIEIIRKSPEGGEFSGGDFGNPAKAIIHSIFSLGGRRKVQFRGEGGPKKITWFCGGAGDR